MPKSTRRQWFNLSAWWRCLMLVFLFYLWIKREHNACHLFRQQFTVIPT